MSASQDKKRRTEERALGTERRQVASQKEAKERKQSKIKWTVGSIIVVLLVAAILIGNSSLFYTARPALQVGDVKYSSAEVNYAYRSAYLTFCNQYGSYLSAVKGTVLYAESRLIKDGRRNCFYEISVTDDLDTPVALVSVTGAHL